MHFCAITNLKIKLKDSSDSEYSDIEKIPDLTQPIIRKKDFLPSWY